MGSDSVMGSARDPGDRTARFCRRVLLDVQKIAASENSAAFFFLLFGGLDADGVKVRGDRVTCASSAVG